MRVCGCGCESVWVWECVGVGVCGCGVFVLACVEDEGDGVKWVGDDRGILYHPTFIMRCIM